MELQLWIGLLAISVGVVFIAEKLKQPYPTFLVIVGLLIGNLPIHQVVLLRNYVTNNHIFITVVITIFLSALIGNSSLKLPFRHIRYNQSPIISLSLMGTLLTFLCVTFFSKYLLHLSFQGSMLFGALMSATDTVSVLSIFKNIGLNKRLSIIIEGESLSNDGISVVLYQTALTMSFFTWKGVLVASFDFVWVITCGIIIGFIFGFTISRLIYRIDNYLIETALSIILFYGAFEFAYTCGVSGVVAVVVAGLTFGQWGRKKWMSPHTLARVDSFWETIAFLSNTMIFLMVGMEISTIRWGNRWLMILLSIGLVVLARMIAVMSSLLFYRKIPFVWKWLITWGGLKGSLSIALILSVAPTFPNKNYITLLTFGNVVFSLFIQGTTIQPIVRWLKRKGIAMSEK